MKGDLFQENTTKYDIFFRSSEKKVFPKRTVVGHDLSCIIWKDCIFSRKTWYFFLSEEARGDLPQEIHGNMIFSKCRYGCFKTGVTHPCQKNQGGSYRAKIHLKVIDVLDWHLGKSSNNSVYPHKDLYGRFHVLLSSEKNRKLNV